ncbi:MAG: O-antigen ligase family protein [Candidatus Kerfeldbacteria bacterium]|nr:O-antigen ligase family protein [Candidatus Kerfeldbacteria bacterium]
MLFALQKRELSQKQLFLIGGACAVILGVGIAVASAPIILVSVILFAFSALVFASPFFGLGLVVFLLPFERLGAYESAFGTIRPSQAIAALLLIAWGVRFLLSRRAARPNPLILPLALFITVNILGLTVAQNLAYGIAILAVTAFTIACGMMIPQIVRSERQLRALMGVLLAAAALTSLFGLFQFLGDLKGLPESITGLRPLYTKAVLGFPRIQSTALEPLYFANYLLIPTCVLYALFLRRKNIVPSWAAFLLLALFATNLALTVSRGGYLGAIAGIGAITLLSLRQFLRLRVLLSIILGVVLVAILVPRILQLGDVARINVETFTRHVGDIFFGASFAERADTVEQARALFWSSPWVGIGPGNFGPAVAIHPLVKPPGGWRIVNNETIELLAETGMFGLLAIVVVVVMLFLRSMKIILRAGPASHATAIHLGLLGGLIGSITQYQTFSVLYIMHVWVLVGLLVAAQNILLYGDDHA